MGSTMCKGGSLQQVLQLNQIKLPKPQRLELLTRLELYKFTTI
jgi:hypothetical protein